MRPRYGCSSGSHEACPPRGHARSRAHARRDPRRRDPRDHRQGPDRGARRCHRQACARQQAHDLSLLRRQGRPLSGGAGGDLRGDPQRRAGAASRRPRSRRRDARTRAVHLALFPRPPGIPQPAGHGKPQPRRLPQALAPHPRAALSACRHDLLAARARREGARVPLRRRPGRSLHHDRGARLLLSLERAHALDHLRPRPLGDAEHGRRAATISSTWCSVSSRCDACPRSS